MNIKFYPENWWKNAKNRLDSKVALLLIVIIGFFFRLLGALNQGWLADETFHINQLANWFLNNFWQYFFQFQHTIFPPASPYFVNPPLASVLMTVAIATGNIFGFSELLSARLVNVFAGTIICVLIYLIGKKIFNGKTGLLAAGLFAISPIAISADASAYLDTVLSMFFLSGFYLLLLYLDKHDMRMLYLSAIPFALAVLTKYYVVPLLIPAFLILGIQVKSGKLKLAHLVNFLLIIILIPMVLWAGARDPAHIMGVANYIHNLNTGDFSPLVEDYTGIKIGENVGPLYYPLMLLGRLSTISSILFLFSIFLFFHNLIFEKRANKFEILILTTILFYTIFIDVFGGVRTTVHRIFALWPLALLFSSGIVMNWINEITESRNREKVQAFAISGILLLSFGELFMWAPADYNAFNNVIIGGVAGGSNLYRVGDGEGLERAGDWLNKNTPAGSRISVPRVGYLLENYVNGRKIIPQPLNEDLDYAFAQGAQYMVLYNSVLSGGINLPIDSNKMKNIYNVRIGNQNYVQVYALVRENIFSRMTFIDLKDTTAWQIDKSRENGAKIFFDGDSMAIDYNITSGTITLKRNLLPNFSDGIFVSLEGNGRGDQIELGWFDSGCVNDEWKNCGFSKSIIVDWKGKKDFYINTKNMTQVNGEADPHKLDRLNITIYSPKKFSNTVKLSGLSLIKRNDAGTEVFLQIDDVAKARNSLTTLLETISDSGYPVTFGVIPAELENATIKSIMESELAKENKISIIQHGWKHDNRGNEDLPDEFPDSEDINQTIIDLNKGKNILVEKFESFFINFYAPPWNRIGQTQLPALEEVGFEGFSNILMKDNYENFFQKNGIRRAFVCNFYSPQISLPENIERFLACKRIAATNTFGIVLHIQDFNSDEDFNQFKDFLNYLKSEKVKVIKLG